MVLLAGKGQPVIPDPHDALDDPDAQSGGLQRVALFDMGFEIADIARRVERLARPAGIPRLGQRVAELLAVAALRGGDLVLAQRAGERAAAEHVAVMPLLVRPRHRLDAEALQRGVRSKSARQFERIDDTERAVEPAAVRLRLAVRADEQPARGAGVAADDIADAVDDRVEPGGGKLFGQPLPRGDILWRIGWPVHTGLVAPEFGQPLQIGDDPRPIGFRHPALLSQTCQRFNPPTPAGKGSAGRPAAYCMAGSAPESTR